MEPNLNLIKKLKKDLNISKYDRVVSFTIRDYKFEEIRNTNYEFLLELDLFLKVRGYRLIVIPDYKNLNPNIDVEVFKDATLDSAKRIAIYNISKINIGTAGGPVWTSRFMRNVNMFKLISPLKEIIQDHIVT